MKKLIVMFAIGLLTQRVIRAQGTTYLSNLSQTSTGSEAVGSDSWFAMDFRAGTNASGYVLNSIQLAMTDATGSPSGFTLTLYSAIRGGDGELFPGSSLGTLNGSLDPVSAGIYTYTPASSLTLLRFTTYFIVLTAGTTVANGAYDWSYNNKGNIYFDNSGDWFAPAGVNGIDNYQSVNGSSWDSTLFFGQYAVTATPVPEPSALGLLGLCSLLFIRHRHKAKTIP